ncbi:MAG: 5'-methylthioadenosine/adenosylhomocysteine nucleosidase [Firmicutes bacterium]|nr:5'-methylthioadenosine/adenosylhomocysteine nucleosidase [Bacillota bacterium]
MIGIIGAMEIEIAGLVGKLTGAREIAAGKITVTTGKLAKTSVAVCRCGIGKVHAATAATLMIRCFPKIDLIINLGVAGGVKPGIKQGDFVVATASVQHDYDLVADGLIKGQIHGYEKTAFDSDSAAVVKMCAVLQKLGFDYEKGIIASGDQFIWDKQKAVELYNEHGAYACDMETAAIAHVCDMFGKRFLGVRSMSDNADGGAVEDFFEFAVKAAERSIAAVEAYIKVR